MSLNIRSRKSTPKVRTGCATCKIRRVKCDETRPTCHRCKTTGRICPGYAPPTGAIQKSSIQIYSIPFKVPGSRTDRELLHFYCSEAAHCLSRFSDSTLWSDLILQQSQYQPVIRNSLIALSSLYREYLVVGSDQLGHSPRSIRLMAKSHKQLLSYLSDPRASPVPALICSLIFYVFECLVGNTRQAIWHLDRGLELLKCFWVSDAGLLARMDPIYPQLRRIFAHLDVHASIFSPERFQVLCLASPDQISGVSHVVPDGFGSINEVDEALITLQNWKLHHLMQSLCWKGTPIDRLPPNIAAERLRLDGEYRRFETAAQRFLSQNDQVLGTNGRQRITLLHTQGLICHGVLLENIIIPSDENFPLEACYKFDLALDQIKSLMSGSSSQSASRGFTVSTNLIAMLYFVCLKTRDPNLLQRSLSLMEQSMFAARDGLWDSQKARFVVQWMRCEDNLGEEGNMDLRLEDIGTGIIDIDGGLDEAVKRLNVGEAKE
ncbi:hypothetical protein N7532_003292 [Penicillium argentinense]|uniref:Zn(2)-C6 fungal-type domain-containing protein n=1 Tax=Penicillium argentinense TaxID=1131581 RepID=A0A9W9KEI4_9EURO|nr:uncharacterized protein N7532_003292 [Penicillium argentinense]KAJ5102763.1 hypothetical protein N7532_003292 [Penicillium argentinense]